MGLDRIRSYLRMAYLWVSLAGDVFRWNADGMTAGNLAKLLDILAKETEHRSTQNILHCDRYFYVDGEYDRRKAHGVVCCQSFPMAPDRRRGPVRPPAGRVHASCVRPAVVRFHGFALAWNRAESLCRSMLV